MNETIEVARGWLERCLGEHSSCRKKTELASIWALGSLYMVRSLDYEDRMPWRLLDLGTEPYRDSAKLVHIGKTTGEIPYVTLSHRVCASLRDFPLR